MASCVHNLGTSTCIPRPRSRTKANKGPSAEEVLDSLPLNERRPAIELLASISAATNSADGLKSLRKDYRAKQKESLKHVWYYRHWHRRGTTPPATCTKPLQGRLKHNPSFQNHKRELEAALVEAKSKIETVETEGKAGAAMLETQEAAELRSKKLYRRAKVDK